MTSIPELRHGDMRDVLRDLAEAGETFHAVITDPPYHLTSIVERWGKGGPEPKEGATGVYARATKGFMGKEWDGGDIAMRPETWRLAWDLLPPGGHLAAFGGTRTFHRMAVAIEDAGFEIRDTLMWLYGSGFPKSHNQKGEWDGWGTALKPAWEPIILARKPLAGTVAANCLAHRTGAINVDTCRVPYVAGAMGPDGTNDDLARLGAPGGRWPANVLHDGSDEVEEAFAAFGNLTSGKGNVRKESGADRAGNRGAAFGAESRPAGSAMVSYGDTGSASRFFFNTGESSCADASTAAEPLPLQSERAVSALSDAVLLGRPGAALFQGSYQARSTSVTAAEFGMICASVTEAIQAFDRRCSLGLPPGEHTVTLGPAMCAARPGPTGTTTITTSLLRFAGSAELATFSITPPSLVPGGAALGSRFHYCGKAASGDRVFQCEGCKTRWMGKRPCACDAKVRGHPTVKPQSLMRWLCRLLTPPGGRVLDCFAGSGSTLAAAHAEGFQALGVERDEEYVGDILHRLTCLPRAPKIEPVQPSKLPAPKKKAAEPLPLFAAMDAP